MKGGERGGEKERDDVRGNCCSEFVMCCSVLHSWMSLLTISMMCNMMSICAKERIVAVFL